MSVIPSRQRASFYSAWFAYCEDDVNPGDSDQFGTGFRMFHPRELRVRKDREWRRFKARVKAKHRKQG